MDQLIFSYFLVTTLTEAVRINPTKHSSVSPLILNTNQAFLGSYFCFIVFGSEGGVCYRNAV